MKESIIHWGVQVHTQHTMQTNARKTHHVECQSFIVIEVHMESNYCPLPNLFPHFPNESHEA